MFTYMRKLAESVEGADFAVLGTRLSRLRSLVR